MTLSSAHINVFRKLDALNDAWAEHPDAPVDPEIALSLADSLDSWAGCLISAIALLRHQAQMEIEARKGVGR